MLEHIENIVVAQVKKNFRENIQQEDFVQTFLSAFTNIQRECASYFDLLLSPSHHTHFMEKLTLEVVPIFKEKFKLPAENFYSEYLALIYFQTIIATMRRWINDGRKLPLEDLAELFSNVITNGVMTEMEKILLQDKR